MNKYMDNIDLSPPFQVQTAGLIQKMPYHSTPGTRGQDMMLMFFLTGRGFYRNESCSKVVTGGTVALIPPTDPGILMADPQDPYVHYYCRFNGPYAIYLANKILKRKGDRFFSFADLDEIVELMRRMGIVHRTHPQREMDLKSVLLAKILIMLAQSNENTSPRITASAIEQYLMDHLAEPNDLDRMADHFNVSKATFCRLTRKLCHRTLVDLAEEKKIQWAKILLETKSQNITEIARRVGYADPFYFSRVFKKRTGQSPSSWQAGTDK
jgi:AraC-like DNA-binding protein